MKNWNILIKSINCGNILLRRKGSWQNGWQYRVYQIFWLVIVWRELSTNWCKNRCSSYFFYCSAFWVPYKGQTKAKLIALVYTVSKLQYMSIEAKKYSPSQWFNKNIPLCLAYFFNDISTLYGLFYTGRVIVHFHFLVAVSYMCFCTQLNEVSKVGNCSWGALEGLLFNSYYTEV